MGRAKGLLSLDGQPIVERLLDRLAWAGATILVTAPGRERPPGWQRFDLEVVDPVDGQGPLRGLLTAIEAAQTSEIVAVAIDMPGLTSAPLLWMVERLLHTPRAAVVMVERMTSRGLQIEPLPMALRTDDALPLIKRKLSVGQLALSGLAEEPRFVVERCPPDWPDQFWTNLNHPNDVSAYLSTGG
jgi:molybdopterin-guanine dinucleotide biosynthesis protein A